MTWGLTAAIVDNSDLWQEELNESKTHYSVDGEWRELSISEEVIKIKGQPDLDLKIRLTHRGPLVETEVLRFNAGLLFGASVAEMFNSDAVYSLGWGGAVIGDTSM